ncbi:MAG: sulfatase, partial [Planctomycetota bacterium]
MSTRPNVVYLFADQLRARGLPLYGGTQFAMPNLNRLATQGTTLDHIVSTCPVCTPYRSMLTTGRHPQTTGFVINSLRPRHDEIGLGDAFKHGGYQTAWVGKWHLYTGGWPANNVPDWVPRGRPRLGFDHWRAYNQHMVYFDGFINSPTEDWAAQQWKGYETEALRDYAFEFMDQARQGDGPFACFISPQPPHWTPYQWAPEQYYDRVPDVIDPPSNVPADAVEEWHRHARNYAAMTLAVDDMLGDVMAYLDEHDLTDNTLLIFTSDHGTQGMSHGVDFFNKKNPYEESFHVPFVARLPGVLEAGVRREALTSPVDLMPTMLSLCDLRVPATCEGLDLSDAWRGEANAVQHESLFTMNFGGGYDNFYDGDEWRGVRTQRWSYAKWLDGREMLFDLETDPLQLVNLVGDAGHTLVLDDLRAKLAVHQRERGDELRPGSSYADWVDKYRRVIRNGCGSSPNPLR